jgi:penicillin amidase
VHRTNARHTLAATFPELGDDLSPPRAGIGGDGDCIQAGSYAWDEGAEFDITGLSVYRQAVDFTDVAQASYVVPAGVSGLPGTAHFADQLEHWRRHERIPMHFAGLNEAAEHSLTLRPRPATGAL